MTRLAHRYAALTAILVSCCLLLNCGVTATVVDGEPDTIATRFLVNLMYWFVCINFGRPLPKPANFPVPHSTLSRCLSTGGCTAAVASEMFDFLNSGDHMPVGLLYGGKDSGIEATVELYTRLLAPSLHLSLPEIYNLNPSDDTSAARKLQNALKEQPSTRLVVISGLELLNSDAFIVLDELSKVLDQDTKMPTAFLYVFLGDGCPDCCSTGCDVRDKVINHPGWIHALPESNPVAFAERVGKLSALPRLTFAERNAIHHQLTSAECAAVPPAALPAPQHSHRDKQPSKLSASPAAAARHRTTGTGKNTSASGTIDTEWIEQHPELVAGIVAALAAGPVILLCLDRRKVKNPGRVPSDPGPISEHMPTASTSEQGYPTPVPDRDAYNELVDENEGLHVEVARLKAHVVTLNAELDFMREKNKELHERRGSSDRDSRPTVVFGSERSHSPRAGVLQQQNMLSTSYHHATSFSPSLASSGESHQEAPEWSERAPHRRLVQLSELSQHGPSQRVGGEVSSPAATKQLDESFSDAMHPASQGTTANEMVTQQPATDISLVPTAGTPSSASRKRGGGGGANRTQNTVQVVELQGPGEVEKSVKRRLE